MMKYVSQAFWLLLFIPVLVFAQTPQEKEKYVMLDDLYKAKQYEKAIPPLNWFLKNKPDFHKNIYIKGYNLYHNLVKETSDAQQKAKYQDKALAIYDMRVKHFGEEAKVMNQKGHYAFFYWGSRPDKVNDLFKLYTKIIALNGNNTYYRSVSNYMYMISQQYRKGNITGKEVVDAYDKLTSIINANMPKYPQHWTEVKNYVDDTFKKIIRSKSKEGKPMLSCEFVNLYYMPNYHKNPNDIETIKEIMRLLIEIRKTNPSAPCGQDSTFAIMSEKLFKATPTYEGALLVISIYKKQKNYAKVEELINQLPDFAKTSKEKASAYYAIAKAKRSAGNKTSARNFALKAAAADAKLASKAYNLIGDMYYNSGQICTNKNPVLNRVVYIAAYEMYQKAGNATKMAKAKVQCPDIVDAHTYGMQKGQLISVGCWIGGKVKLMLR
ncbi:hypothetical protein [uncultured Microscilla sp.]|uniref:hypothetical protein n=1 Tax=uncultured Microscilla sp. TaxID=432653 RepID=UPI00262F132A|nr:hypothetical protein [uncultured Microscilla sp.]